MGDRKLTAQSAAKKYPPGATLRLTCPVVTGLGLVVMASGKKSWTLRYASPTLRDKHGRGKRQELTIGAYPALGLKEARAKAREVGKRVYEGIDPKETRDDARREPTWNDLADVYADQHLPTKTDAPKDLSRLRRYILPAWGNRKITAVGKAEIRKLHKKITTAGYPGAADRVLAQVSKMINFAQEQDLAPVARNPCSLIRRNGQQTFHEYLNKQETAAVLAALETVERAWDDPGAGYPAGSVANWRRWAFEQATAVRVIIYSGLRHSQALSLRWSDLDRDRSRLHVARRKAKKGKRQDTWIPVDGYVFELLDGLGRPDIGDHWCFPSPHGKGRRRSLQAFWDKVLAEAQIEHRRIHDLRHTYASAALSNGATLDEVQRLLGHVSRQSTEVYADLVPEAGARAASLAVQRLRMIK